MDIDTLSSSQLTMTLTDGDFLGLSLNGPCPAADNVSSVLWSLEDGSLALIGKLIKDGLKRMIRMKDDLNENN